MLDAMREVGQTRCRGIVDIDENATDAAPERMILSDNPARCFGF